MIFSVQKLSKKVNSVHLIILWFCRILGLTFGGLVIKENGEFSVNKTLKIYGNFITIIIIIFEIFFYIEFKDEYDFIYESNFKIFYSITNTILVFTYVNTILNLFYIQFKGFDLCKLWFSYRLEKLRNKIIVLIIFFTLMSAHLIEVFLRTSLISNIDILNFLLKLIENVYFTIGLILIKTMTWCKS
jgi:hypothetical protein